MKHINFNAPINPLSFGNVSINFLRELHKKDIKVSFFPIGSQLDFNSFDSLSDDFKDWVTRSYNTRYSTLRKSSPTLRLWHLSGSENQIGSRQFLYTFYELNNPTLAEKNICDNQERCIFSSSHSLQRFKEVGCTNTSFIPIGFDPDFHETDKTYHPDLVHFGLMGKFEKRKHTARILRLWAENYGNNKDYLLSCCITNPFIKPEQMNQLLREAFSGSKPSNINILPFLPANSQVNEFLNSINIDLTGLSGAEGWNLPAFNATALGKWSIVLNCTSHKDWATSENSILVEPSGQEDAHDGVFFHAGQEFNQGQINTFSDEAFTEAVSTALKKCNQKNTEGIKLQNQFTYEKTINKILQLIENET